ncbi:hypothetical protein CKA55_13225, partial [Arcobacter suis]
MSVIEKIEKIRDAKWFSNLTTFIILAYASVLGFKTIDEVEANYAIFLQFADAFVTIYFIFEIAIKMAAEKKFINFFKSGWNVFDFTIVVITLLPLEQSGFAAIARMLRVFRVLRLFTARPELKAIIDMLIKAIPSIID